MSGYVQMSALSVVVSV